MLSFTLNNAKQLKLCDSQNHNIIFYDATFEYACDLAVFIIDFVFSEHYQKRGSSVFLIAI